MVTECKLYRLRTFIKVTHRPLHEIKTIEVRLKGACGECSAVAEASDAWRESRGYVYVRVGTRRGQCSRYRNSPPERTTDHARIAVFILFVY